MDYSSAALDLAKDTDAANSASMTDVTNRIRSDIRNLAPEITARTTEIEAGRRVPADLVGKLRSIGIFRALAPRSHGGLELDLPASMKIVETLSRIEGSVGWITMIGMGSAIFAPLLRREVYDKIYAKGPDVIFGGSAQAAGTAEATAGGWRVSGRWPFASGCQHADWMFGLCIMSKDGKPLPGPAGDGGPPQVRGFTLPAQDWRIEDTWRVAGLRGTGSHHIAIKDKMVPQENFFDLDGDSCMPGPLYQTVQQFIPVMHIPSAIGIAAGALDELRVLANSGVQQQRTTVPMRDTELFQQDLGRIEAEFRAARAYADAQTESHWRHALAGTLKDEALLIQGAQAATWITSACVRVADECFRLGGGSALYETSPLQRRARDLHAAAQHAGVHQRIYGGAGKLLLGNPSAIGVRIA
jgi:alkylation response protein AidB-like acyl-CoA dehydrogenase